MKRLILEAVRLDVGAGEGSRGGHVIGHTKSGEPIYEGHTWKSVNGEKTIAGLHSTGRIAVRVGSSNQHELYSPDDVLKQRDFDVKKAAQLEKNQPKAVK